ncbi:MAG: hypothetical protein NVS2B16_10480 [Chloroflexota bacterium]
MARQIQVTFDRLDPEMLAGFWAAALHDAVEAPPEGYATWTWASPGGRQPVHSA